jgi:secreted PhoX family phosphatase
LHSGEKLRARWVTIHDTDTDGTAPFSANEAAKTLGATPFKRPENGKFVPGSDFRSFVFGETGDTDNRAGTYVSPADGAKAADRGAWGALLRIDMKSSGSDKATVRTILNGDADHAAFDNIAFLSRKTILVAEDRGDTLHGQLNFLDSLWAFNLRESLESITGDGRRVEAQGRDAAALADVEKHEADPEVADQNDGDNEVTGIHVSNGRTTTEGVLGGEDDPFDDRDWRIFVTQQHGLNITYELTPPHWR